MSELKLKVKLICYCLSNSHVYSTMGHKLKNVYLLEKDINDVDNLKLCVFNKYKCRNKNITKEELIVITNKYIDDIFTDNENASKLIFEMFANYDGDFNYPFLPMDKIQELSPNVKNVIGKILLQHIELMHDQNTRSKICCYDLIDIIYDSNLNLDELLEYALFAAKYSVYSSIGYIAQMSYSNSNIWDAFNIPLELDTYVAQLNDN